MASLLRLMLPFAAAVAVVSVLRRQCRRRPPSQIWRWRIREQQRKGRVAPASGTGLCNESGSTHHAIIDAIDTSAPPDGAGIAPTPGVAGNSCLMIGIGYLRAAEATSSHGAGDRLSTIISPAASGSDPNPHPAGFGPIPGRACRTAMPAGRCRPNGRNDVAASANSRARQCASPLGVIGDQCLLRGRQLGRQRQQFVDLQRLGSSLDPDRVELAPGESLAGKGDRRLGSDDGGAVEFVGAFQPRGEVHRVAHDRVVEAPPRSEIADQRLAGIDPDPLRQLVFVEERPKTR